MGKGVKFSSLTGLELQKVVGAKIHSGRVDFITNKGVFSLLHYQDCCESVLLADINGNPEKMSGKILQADEVSYRPLDQEQYDSVTWTFYRVSTANGYLVLRWVGESNGYYSESVDCVLNADDDDGRGR